MIRTAFLLTLLTLLLVFVGGLIGQRTGMIIAFGIGLLLNFFNYWFSSRIVLAVYRAKPLAEGELPTLVQDVRELAGRAGLPMPKVALIENPAPNAFATGRNPRNAVVAVTTGLLQTLDRRQVRAVIGHELGHVKNRDMLTMTLVAGAVSAIGLLAHFGYMFGGFGHRGSQDEEAPSPIVGILVMLLAPLMAVMIQMAISRSREYAADDSGAEVSGDPGALADGLEALHRAIPHRPPLSRTGATAHMMIANPFFGMNLGHLFSTHPDPARRIARLRAKAAGR